MSNGEAAWRRSTLTLLLAIMACSPPPGVPGNGAYTLLPLTSNTTASMRGVSVVDAQVAWVSGTGGVVLRTTDGGATWTNHTVPRADSLDFRDIEAFDSLTAYVLSAGEDGRIYKTTNGGRAWTLLFRNQIKDAFFDCLGFWDTRHGLAFSDPVNGRFLIMRTDDGLSWRQVPAAVLPAPLAGEAAFAASGTCLVAVGSQRALFATGGGPEARVFVTNDRGNSWHATATPVSAGAPSAGIFSLAFTDARSGIAIGGDYQKPEQESVIAATNDGGRTWLPTGRTAYVSGAALLGTTIVAVGTKGTRVSPDRGVSWVTLDTVEYNAVQLSAEGTGFAVGPRGRIAKLVKR